MSNRFLPGFCGHDSMREKAERELRHHADHAGGPENMPTKHVGRISSFKKGGHASHRHHHDGMKSMHKEHENLMKHMKRLEHMEASEHRGHKKKHHYKHGGHVHGLQRDQKELYIPHHLKHSAHRAEGGEMKRGGHAHHKHHSRHMNEGGISYNLPNMAPPGPIGLERMAAAGQSLRKGGRTHHKHHSRHMNEGGLLDSAAVSPGPIMQPRMPSLRKGGKAHHKHHYASGGYAHGGDVYEHEMVGEHPTHAMHHYNYESIMRGEHPTHVPRRTHHEMAGRDDETQGQVYKRRGGHVKKMAMGGVGKIRHNQATSSGRPMRHKLDLSR